ncbi:Structural maintenance of chromosomes protein 2 [Dimargaris verticillata]|uniref:Structural maintenance of chromosomes protein 2 n=1 Tax=Dimargaris verticillata TaxID=2761393 RepID=A0A9W8B7X1_9FUNG|nr:Structural maintenance of chromosomes protein 2 [Dimargaris verticillata]
MRVEEVIIDGFKSYAARTHITGWDPEFNAITGLNGSGKSNILDAICFVLGLKNLSHVRAGSLQDLVYKRGQAGITKASVTIVFNNEDRSKSPLGYEDSKQISVTRQILIGGKNKYMINGHNAQEQTVANLFQSVQLNVNNPHFLIMQGKITKVLNMKAPEILSMIEEAAGTRMFEERKEKAHKTMTKKEKKVEEITAILKEEITPKLDKLRNEKRAFLEYQKLEIEVDRLTRLVVAYEYTQSQEKVNQSDQDREAQVVRQRALQERLQTLATELKNLKEDIQQIEHNKQSAMSGGGRYLELQKSVDDYAKELVRSKTQCDLKAANLLEEQQNHQTFVSSLAETNTTLHEKRDQLATLNQQFEGVKAEHDAKMHAVSQAEDLIQTLTTGVSAEEGHENGYMEQLQQAKQRISQATTTMEQAKRKIAHVKQQITTTEPKARRAEKENHSLLRQLETEKQQLVGLRDQLAKLQWDPAREEALRQQQAEAQAVLVKLRDQRDQHAAQLGAVDFQFTDPMPNFDRSQVKGLVANLVRLDQAHYSASTALEICAGGRLYNVVVANEVVGGQLLEKGKLRRRVTIIPLNKIQAFRAAAAKIATAKQVASGNVELALELVGYDGEVASAMTYVFGNTLICQDAATAEQVTFHKDVRMKSVTLDGDVYDPSGTLQGGSKPSSSGLLVKLQMLHALQDQINHHQQLLDDVQSRLAAAQRTIARFNELTQAIDLKAHEVSLLEDRLAKTTHAQLVQQLDSLRTELETLSEQIQEAESVRQASQQQCEYIEQEMREFQQDKTAKLKEMKANLKTAKAGLTNATQQVKQMQRDVQTLSLEIDQLEVDKQALQDQIATAEQTVKDATAEEEALRQAMYALKEQLDAAQAALTEEKAALHSFDEELRELDRLRKTKSSQHTDIQLELQTLNRDMERFDRDQGSARQAIRALEQKYDWIADSKHMFGQADTAFDFLGQNPHEAKKQLRQLEERHTRLRRTTNTSVMANIENVEKRESALKQMLSTVLKDKRKIEDTIVSLDDYKRDALEHTWRVVNKDFGEIFGDLLAGCSAKLEPPEGKTLMEGLEVKVCLGGVWKQSLTELSGGQR